jgi:hypothetical protein
VELLEPRLQPSSLVTGGAVDGSLLGSRLFDLEDGLSDDVFGTAGWHRQATERTVALLDPPHGTPAGSGAAESQGPPATGAPSGASPAPAVSRAALPAATQLLSYLNTAAPRPATVAVPAQRNALPAVEAGPTPAVAPLTARTLPLPAPQPFTAFGKGAARQSGSGLASSMPVGASYAGGALEDRLLGVALDRSPGATQPVVMTGFTQVDDTTYNLYMVRSDTDLEGALTDASFGSPGTRTEGHAVDVDRNTGSVYVTGQTDVDGVTTAFVLSLQPDLVTMNWMVTLPTNTGSTGNGLKLDTTSTNLYVTGQLDGNVFVLELTDLDTANPTMVAGATYDLFGPSVGNAIVPDSTGRMGVALQTPDPSGNNLPSYLVAAPDATLLIAVGFHSAGAKGNMRGIDVDATDHFFLSGEQVPDGSNKANLIMVAVNSVTLLPIYFPTYTLPTGGDFVGYGSAVDSLDDNIAAVTDNGPQGRGGNMALFTLDARGNRIDYQGNAGGPLDDQNRALVMDEASHTLYMAGFTSSPTFTDTPGHFQPDYGGGASDGVVIEETFMYP